jgi:hypothetical protein
MKKYHVDVTEQNFGWTEVEAENEVEAREKGYAAIDQGSIQWNDSDSRVDGVEEIV